MAYEALGYTPRYSPSTSTHPVDEVLPTWRLIILGIQHLFVMYAGAVAVPLIIGDVLKLDVDVVARLVNADLMLSGIFTIIQAVGIGKKWWGPGVRLPVVTGATFTVLTPYMIIAQKFGLQDVYGAMLVSGVFGILMARPFSKVIRFFPPLVTGCTILIIGLSLIGADISLIAGNNPSAATFGALKPMGVAAFVVILIIAITRFFHGFMRQIATLLAIVIGTLLALALGMGNFHAVDQAAWAGFSGFFYFGVPKFHAAPILAMCIVMIVTFTESTADMLAVAEIVDRKLSPEDLSRGLMNDAVSGFCAGFTNSFPDTSFAENVGLVELTNIRSRWVVAVCGAFLLVMGFIPKLGALIASIPDPVIGGAATVMFAMVAAVGIRTLFKVNFKGNQNMLIVAVSLAMGLLPAIQPKIYQNLSDDLQVIFGSSITATVICVFVLNLIFNVWGKHPGGEDSLGPSITSGLDPDTSADADGKAEAAVR